MAGRSENRVQRIKGERWGLIARRRLSGGGRGSDFSDLGFQLFFTGSRRIATDTSLRHNVSMDYTETTYTCNVINRIECGVSQLSAVLGFTTADETTEAMFSNASEWK